MECGSSSLSRSPKSPAALRASISEIAAAEKITSWSGALSPTADA